MYVFMKRSKIFLGTTTCLLAIIGVAATKAAKFGNTSVSYFTQVRPASQPHACVTVSAQPCTVIVTGNQCRYYTSGGTVTTFPLYTGVNTDALCTVKTQYWPD